MCLRFRCRARTVTFQKMVYRPKTEFDRDPRAGRGRTRVELEEWDRSRPRLLLDRDLETFAHRLADMVGPDGHWSGRNSGLTLHQLLGRFDGPRSKAGVRAYLLEGLNYHGLIDVQIGRFRTEVFLTLPDYCRSSSGKENALERIKPLGFRSTEFCFCHLKEGGYVALGCRSCRLIAGTFEVALRNRFFYEVQRVTFGYGRRWGSDEIPTNLVGESARAVFLRGLRLAAGLARHRPLDEEHHSAGRYPIDLILREVQTRLILQKDGKAPLSNPNLDVSQDFYSKPDEAFHDMQRERKWNKIHGISSQISRDPFSKYNASLAPWNSAAVPGRKCLCGMAPPTGALFCPRCGRKSKNI